ncbi:MAG: hypothetical protein M3Y91_18395 [Actinomycetota bacterium]|nr:hypothetical protein [Actinomycetota bacterium]
MTAARPACSLQLVPVTLAEAKRFVGCHHRHALPPVTWRFGVGVDSDGGLAGVGMAGNPTARKLAQADPYPIEIVRVTVVDAANACSMLYAALCRAARALGYRRAITYTLATEPGTSLRAAGFTLAAELPTSRGWDQPSRHRYQCDLFGNARTPEGPKRRWERRLSA